MHTKKIDMPIGPFETPQSVENKFMSAHQWLNKFLTAEEYSELLDRTGTTNMNVWYFEFDEALWTRFKYLYKPLTKKEWNRWKKVSDRANKQIELEGSMEIKRFVDSLDEKQLQELKDLLKDK